MGNGIPRIPPGHLLVDSAAGQALIGEAACVRWEQKLSDARLRGVRVHCKMMTPKRGRRCSTSHKIDDDAYCDRRTPWGRRRHPGTEHLCLEDHSQSLAALLLKNTGNSLRGERFGSSICEEDREGFELFMTGTCESAPAQCLHLHLRDTCGAKFLVEVFHYHLEGHHLLGIKEETERAPQPHEQEIMAVPSTGSLRWE